MTGYFRKLSGCPNSEYWCELGLVLLVMEGAHILIY